MRPLGPDKGGVAAAARLVGLKVVAEWAAGLVEFPPRDLGKERGASPCVASISAAVLCGGNGVLGSSLAGRDWSW